jgi:transposase
MALYEISQGKNATQLSRTTSRNHPTVMGWVHRYNAFGPDSLLYRHTGGHPPPLPAELFALP